MEKAELMREIEARDVALEQAHTELEELTSSQQKENKRVAKLRHELCETQVRAQVSGFAWLIVIRVSQPVLVICGNPGVA